MISGLAVDDLAIRRGERLLFDHLSFGAVAGEAIALVGYYHTISFLCVGLELPLETYAARFPAR